MCRRLLIVSILAMAMTCVSSVAGSAGGYDTLNFPRDHYLVGQVADVRDEFFAGGLEGAGTLAAGPYYAYLLPQRGRSSAMIEPPTIPSRSIRLGALQIEGPTVRGGWRYGIASLTFTVPDVPSGRYTVGFCDDPCAHSIVGYLAFGWITIVHTPYEASLLGRIDRLREHRRALRNEARRAVRASNALRLTLGRTLAALHATRLAAPPPAEGAIPASVPVQPERNGSSVGWLTLLAAFPGVVVGALIGRRRRRTKVERGRAEEPMIARGARERELAEV